MKNFVFIDEYGILGSNFYWQKGNEIGLLKEELKRVGLTDERIKIHKDLIKPLLTADKELQKHGYQIYVTEGYRSKELYELLSQKMVERIGEKGKNKILNTKDMPHSTGRSIDVALWKDNQVFRLHDKADGINGYFINFYKEKKPKYQKLQDLLTGIMQDSGFRLGTKGEYFHFNYNPDMPRNY
jgi:D-alanyl-D-alanine dipeptidase